MLAVNFSALMLYLVIFVTGVFMLLWVLYNLYSAIKHRKPQPWESYKPDNPPLQQSNTDPTN